MMSPPQNYRFPVSIQITLPERFEGRDFHTTCALLTEYGISGVELNIADPKDVDPQQLMDVLHQHGLRMNMFASGLTAQREHLSLSHHNEEIRQRSVQRCIEFIDFAAEFSAGVIIGFLKGGPADDKESARDAFKRSLGKLLPHAETKTVALLVEATNRYESAIANSLHDAFDIIHIFDSPLLQILPDTYHMNIEEHHVYGALVRYRDFYSSIHISDNTRNFPGLSALAFGPLVQFLHDMDYRGGLAIEGNLRSDFKTDLERSMAMLTPCLAGPFD